MPVKKLSFTLWDVLLISLILASFIYILKRTPFDDFLYRLAWFIFGSSVLFFSWNLIKKKAHIDDYLEIK